MRIPLLPPPGINSNDTSFSIPSLCVDGDNVRWVDGKPQTIGGWTKYIGTQMTGICRNILSWYDLNGSLNIAFGTNSKLYVYRDGAVYDITPAGLAAGPVDGAGGSGFGAGDYGEGDYGEGSPSEYYPRTWSLDTWGQNLIASPRGGTIYVWENNTGSVATEITQAPDNCTAVIVTPERQILAIGCNEEVSTTFNSRCVRGCDIGDYTSWTTTSSNNVFEHILEGNGGNCVAGRMVGQYVGIWTDRGLFMGDFLGDPAQTYRFDQQTGSAGLCGPNAVQVYNKRAWWITRDYQFFSWAPGEPPQIVSCPIRDDFKDNVTSGQFEKIAATSISQYGEIWWFYPDARDGRECSRYISLNTAVALDSPLIWSRGTLARTAGADSGPTRHPIFVSDDSYIYSHEDGADANGGAIAWSITIQLAYLDEGGRFVVIKGIEPDFKSQVGGVSLSLALRKYPQSPARSKGPYALGPSKTFKPFLASGRVAELTFSGNSAPTFAGFGKPVLIAEPTSQE